MKRTLLALCLLPAAVLANDFPTADRVVFVQDCMKANPGPHFEMINKCSCAMDNVASKVKRDDFVEMQTVVNATTIGGERGSEFRDNESIKPQIKRYRELLSEANKSCFITPR